MQEQMNKVVSFVKENPLKTAGIVVGVAVGAFVLVKAVQYGTEVPAELETIANAMEEVSETVIDAA
jgi:hypothetical protein